MVNKEYKRKKEKLNIDSWVNAEIEKRKKIFQKPQETDFIFTFLYYNNFECNYQYFY